MIRITGVTLREKVKLVDIRNALGVSSIQEKVREMRLCWYGHMQRMEENNEVTAVGDILPLYSSTLSQMQQFLHAGLALRQCQ